MRDRQHVFAVAATAGALALILSTVPRLVVGVAMDRIVDGGATWLPTVGTVGETAVLYSYGVAIVAGLGLLVPGFVLGYYLANRYDVRRDFRRFVDTLVSGSTAGVVLAGVGAVTLGGLVGGGSIGVVGVSAWSLTIVVLGVVRVVVEVALVVTVAALAGVAVALFDTTPRPPEVGSSGTNASPNPSIRDD